MPRPDFVIARRLIAASAAVCWLAGCLGEEPPSGEWSWYPDPPSAVSDATTEFRLALRYLNGEGVPRDPEAAYQLLRGAADRGHGDSTFLVARLREEGLGVVRDEKQAMDWYERAARAGHIEAQLLTGRAYYRGDGRQLNPAKGARWFQRAASRGNAEAQYLLGIAYHLGRGVPRDEIKAVEWLEAAAEQNHPHAQYLSGDAYSDGWHGERDRAWAARWYARAAGLGLAGAQYKVGLFHLGGLGVPRNLVEAHVWLSIASESGLGDADRLLRVVEEMMAEGELEQAIRRARAWRPWPVPEAAGDDAPVDDPPSVVFAQVALLALGYRPGELDGRLGPETRRALAAYQGEKSLARDGVLTRALLHRLKADRPKKP